MTIFSNKNPRAKNGGGWFFHQAVIAGEMGEPIFNTVDGKNPAPVDMKNISFSIGFHIC